MQQLSLLRKCLFFNRGYPQFNAVIPAKAGIQWMLVFKNTKAVWIPAFAGTTVVTVTWCQIESVSEVSITQVNTLWLRPAAALGITQRMFSVL